MASWTQYLNLWISTPTAQGDAGQKLNLNFSYIADTLASLATTISSLNTVFLPLTGGTLSGDLNMVGHSIEVLSIDASVVSADTITSSGGPDLLLDARVTIDNGLVLANGGTITGFGSSINFASADGFIFTTASYPDALFSISDGTVAIGDYGPDLNNTFIEVNDPAKSILLSSTGIVSTINNTLDDGAGNTTIAGNLTLSFGSLNFSSNLQIAYVDYNDGGIGFTDSDGNQLVWDDGLYTQDQNVDVGTGAILSTTAVTQNLYIGVGTGTKSLVLHQRSTTDGFQLTGTSISNTNTGTGFLVALGYNQLGNKQMWLGDGDYAGLTTGFFNRFVTYNGACLIDVVRGDGNATGTIQLGGSSGSKVIIGDSVFTSTAPGSQCWINQGLAVGSSYKSNTAPTDGAIILGHVGIGTASPSTALQVAGTITSTQLTMIGNNGGSIAIEPFAFHTAWIDMPAIAGYASGIGSGGPGINPWIAYCGATLQWFSDSAVGDLAYRNGSGNILIGATTGASQLSITPTACNVARTGNLGFYGATAIAQPSTHGTTTGSNTGTGSSVLVGSTFTGNTGSTQYTIGDIVRSLKSLGLLAA